MGQQLRMTPQLQQAIRLLQLSTLDLELEIQQALDSNFMLEEIDPEADEYSTEEDIAQPDTENRDTPEDGGDEITESIADELLSMDPDSSEAPDIQEYVDENLGSVPEIDGDTVADTSQQVAEESIGDELPVDSAWEDVFDDFTPASSSAPMDGGDENYLETRNAEDASIQSHLQDQISLLNLTEQDLFIALAIIDGLNPDGVLELETEDILQSAPAEWELEIEEVEAVLNLIQHLDPVGVASRSLQECLAIQLRELPDTTPGKEHALEVVNNYIGQLANRDYTLLARKLKIKEPQLKEVITLIQSLNPRPGADIAAGNTDYVEPDVLVAKKNGQWLVELNPKCTPRIRVNQEYASLIRRGDTSDDSTQLRNHLQEAKWFLKSLQQRNDTLLRVATKIVEYQRGFLEYGEQAMKPLVLHDIAKAVDLHESTISRVTTQKYMLTPSGMYELKYFFSSHVSTHTGGEVSSTAIRALIKKLVAEENPRKPLSDSKIAKLLAEQNINVARRTIAKYREGLMIPPSNERKQLI